LRRELEVEGVIREVEESKGWLLVHLDSLDKPVAFSPEVKGQVARSLPPKGSRVRCRVKEGYKWHFATSPVLEVVARAKEPVEQSQAPPKATEAPKAPDGELKMLSVDEVAGSSFLSLAGVERPLDAEFLESVKRQGVVEPIIVRELDGVYELVAGHRRLQAAKAAGLKEIPAVVRQLNDKEAAELLLVENLHRRDFSPVEEAKLYKAMIDILGYTETGIAHKVGKSQGRIAELLALLDLPEKVQEMIHYGQLTVKHGRVLHRLAKQDPEKAVMLAEKAVAEQWSAGRLEEEVDRLLEESATPADSIARAIPSAEVAESAVEKHPEAEAEQAEAETVYAVAEAEQAEEVYGEAEESSVQMEAEREPLYSEYKEGERVEPEEARREFVEEHVSLLRQHIQAVERSVEKLLQPRLRDCFTVVDAEFKECSMCPVKPACESLASKLRELLSIHPRLRKVVGGG